MTSYEGINGSLALLPLLKEDESSLISLDSPRHEVRKYFLFINVEASMSVLGDECYELQCSVTVKDGHYFLDHLMRIH